MITITKKLEFDAGHRIHDHRSQCKNLHGHRYVIEITVQGDILEIPGDSSNGMIMDFSDIKAIAKTHIVDKWDHAFIVYNEDHEVVNFLNSLDGHKTISIDLIPTAENLAQIAFNILAPEYTAKYQNNLRLAKLRLFETPNCWVDVTSVG